MEDVVKFLIELFQKNEIFQGAFYGALLGGLAIFSFDRVNNRLNKLSELKKKHFKSLFKLSITLNNYLNVVNENLLFAGSTLDKFKSGVINQSSFSKFTFRSELYYDLQSIELINQLFEFNIKTRQINKDLENFNSAYHKIADLRFVNSISQEQYDLNLKSLTEPLEKMESNLRLYWKDIFFLLAYVRIFMGIKQMWIVRLINRFNKLSFIKKWFANRVKEEKKKIKKEIVANRGSDGNELPTVF